MTKAILFDLGNVIVPVDFREAYSKVGELCGCTPAEVPSRIGATDLVQRFERGQMEPREFAGRLCQSLKIDLEYDDFCHLWRSMLAPGTLVPENMLIGLSPRYRLILVSNTNAIHFEMILAAYPMLKHFDGFVLSYRIGHLKPSPEIYEEAVKRAGCDAAECLFVDDVPAYVEGARRSGLDAVVFTGLDALQQEFRSRGIEI